MSIIMDTSATEPVFFTRTLSEETLHNILCLFLPAISALIGGQLTYHLILLRLIRQHEDN